MIRQIDWDEFKELVDIITGASYDAAAEEAYRKQQHEEEERKRKEEAELLAKQLKEREKQDQIAKVKELEKSYEEEMDRLVQMVQALQAKEISKLKDLDTEPCPGAQAAMMGVLSLLGHPPDDFASWGKSTYQVAKTGKFSLKYRIGTFDMKLVNPTVISDVKMYFRPIEDEELLLKECLPIGTFHKWALGVLKLYPKYKEMVAAQRVAKGLPPEKEIQVKSVKKNVFGSIFSKKAQSKLSALVKVTQANKTIADDPAVKENNASLKKVGESSIEKKAAAPLASLVGLGTSPVDEKPAVSEHSASSEDEITGSKDKDKEKKKKSKKDKKKEKKQKKKEKKAKEAEATVEPPKLNLPSAEELEQQSLQMSLGQPATDRKEEKDQEQEEAPSALSNREPMRGEKVDLKSLKSSTESGSKKNFKALWKMPLMANKFKARTAFGTPRAAAGF